MNMIYKRTLAAVTAIICVGCSLSGAGGIFGGCDILPSAVTAHAETQKEYELMGHRIQVKNILQNPELPTGCEITSLTILLRHLGFSADNVTMARKYLPQQQFYEKDGKLYGADFRTTFAGDPESKYSYGCYAPCIVKAANKFLTIRDSELTAYDVSGVSFEKLLNDYIDNDIPVLIWITSNDLHEPKLTAKWTTPKGETVQWLAYEHCVVLTGYDIKQNKVYVSDPLVGNTSYDLNKLKLRYNQLGKQGVCITY